MAAKYRGVESEVLAVGSHCIWPGLAELLAFVMTQEQELFQMMAMMVMMMKTDCSLEEEVDQTSVHK